jgi:Cys-tRNA(Pro)/Cys-tRNA(Cys) deacylase
VRGIISQTGGAQEKPLTRTAARSDLSPQAGRGESGVMAKGTPATLALEKAGVAFTLHEYDYDPNATRIGMQAAEALGIEPARLLKTLMAKAGGAVVCVLIASDRDVSLKRLAAAAGAKDAAMLPPAEAERITGYHVGGISPLGQRRKVRTFIDAGALLHRTVFVNGGRRGLQIEIEPRELVNLLGAKAAELAT